MATELSTQPSGAPARPEKKTLSGLREIEAALKFAPVFCTVEGLPNLAYIVRDVKREKEKSDMVVKVRILEGWKMPEEVWTVA